ncbi:hypothetical protein D3C85_863680 [compost metagenome]
MGRAGYIHIRCQTGIEHHHLRASVEHGRSGDVQLFDFRQLFAECRQIAECHIAVGVYLLNAVFGGL